MKNKFTLSFRGRIFAAFVLCCFCVVMLRQNLDALFSYIIWPDSVDSFPGSTREWAMFVAGLMVFVLGAFAFYRLITRIIRDESARRVKAQNLIYAAIAHDLKTPMTSVQGYAAALRDGKIPPGEQAEACDIICRKSRRMNELVDSLFDYARLGTEEYHLKSEPIDAAQIVREVAADSYTDFEAKGIALDVDIPDGPLMILGDAREFRRAVTNLIVNAWKHNTAGAKVRVTAKEADGKPLFSVADDGDPIPPEAREAILRPFVTADEARTSRGGSGLGLAISAKIIALMGGTLRVVDAGGAYVKAFEIRGLSGCRSHGCRSREGSAAAKP